MDVQGIRHVLETIGRLKVGVGGKEVRPEGLDESRVGPFIPKLLTVVLERGEVVHHRVQPFVQAVALELDTTGILATLGISQLCPSPVWGPGRHVHVLIFIERSAYDLREGIARQAVRLPHLRTFSNDPPSTFLGRLWVYGRSRTFCTIGCVAGVRTLYYR